MRRRAEATLGRSLAPERSALMRGLVLGQDEAISEPVREDFRGSGLGHLLAVSGQNVMLLSALAWPLLAAAGAGIRLRRAALLGLIAVYVPLAGAGPSLQRAGVMGAAGVVALAAGRPASRWYALLLAAAVTLALNPRASGDPGWQLSFAAVVGIVCLAPPLRSSLRGLPRPLAEGVAMTVAATLATAPLLAHHFGTVPLAGLPANLLALPAVAPVMWAGMLAIAFAQAGALSEGWEWAAELAAKPIALVADVLLAYLEEVARRAAALPGSQLDLSLGSGWSVVAAYAVLAALMLGARRVLRSAESSIEPRKAAVGRGLRRHRGAALAGTVALLALGATRLLIPAPPPEALTVSFLDVGQGDATLVQHPDGSAVLFDGGPPEAGVHRLLRQAGVRRLSAVVATHASRDHHGGLVEVLRRFPVDLLLDGGDGKPDPDFRRLQAEADRRGIRRLPALAGQRIRAGSIAVNVLSPPPRPPGPAPEDPNPRAVVAIVSAGSFDLFLSADAESEALGALELPDVEAMKVPHHGSSDPGLPAVLRRLRPQVAAIEVGRDNGYGHPAPSTLAALEAAVPRVHRTDLDGTVRLSVEGSALEVATER
jgi:competence protein ComEC